MEMRRLWKVLGLLAVVAVLSAPVTRAEEAPAMDEGPNQGNVSASIGFDFTSFYMFRGMAQENQGVIFQPYGGVGIDLWSNDQFSVSMHVDVWGSLHENLAPGSVLYEVDYVVGFTVGMPYGLEADISYVWLTSPASGGQFAQEIDITLSFDDTELWKKAGVDLSLSPYVMVAIETSGGSDNGTEQGIYLEVGISYEREILSETDYPVTLSAALYAGFSLDGEYFEPSAGTEDDGFGYVAVDLGASVPLGFIPPEYGEWSAGVTVTLWFLSDDASTIGGPGAFGVTGGDDFEVTVTAGVSMEY